MRPNVRETAVPVRLSEVRLLAGGEFKLVMANFAFGVVVVVMMHVWEYLLVAAVLHLALMIVARSDARAREIYLEYARQGDRYVPWPDPQRQRRNRRPAGFARKDLQ